MTVYIGAILLTVLGFSALYYQIQIASIKDKIFNKLRMQAFKIASSAIDAQMMNKKFTISKDIDYMLFDKNKKVIDSSFEEEIDFTKEFYIKGDSAYYIDKGAKGHLGISYIVVRDHNFNKYINEIFKKTSFIAIFATIFLMIVGWYLGRLFLKPMKEKIKELDRFIKDSTHELNTPITSILLATQKIEQKGVKPIYLNSLKMSAKLISRIYQDMSFISFDKHKKVEKKVLDIKEKIENSLGFFEVLIEQKNLKIDKKLNECKIEADPSHIDILIKNLVDNAIKYSYPNSTIKIELKNCLFTISNRGKKIQKDKLKEIFQRYKRADSSTGGFGIGLDIVSTICKKYGFKIEVVSKDDTTTFIITF